MKDAQEYAERIEAGTRSFVSDVRKTSAQNDLYRSTSNRYLGGVCGGLAERYKFDATLIRLIFLGLSFTGSIGVWVYIILWIFLPTDVEIAGELEANVADVPPMPKSGPYVDVPGMDPVDPKAPNTAGESPATPSTETPEAEGTTVEDNKDFPDPDATL